MRDDRRVGASCFGDGQRHRGLGRMSGARMEDVVARLLGTVQDAGDVSNPDRRAVSRREHERPNVGGRAQLVARFDEGFLAARRETPRRHGDPSGRERPGDERRRKTAGRQRLRVELHADLAPGAAQKRRRRNVGHGANGLFELGRHAAQRHRVVPPRREGHGQNRHVVDRPGDDRQNLRPLRKPASRRFDLRAYVDDRPLGVGADEKAHHEHRPRRARRGVDVFDLGDLAHRPFEGHGHQTLDVGRGRPHPSGEHIDHRDDDLRLFFSRGGQDRENSERKGRDHQKGR